MKELENGHKIFLIKTLCELSVAMKNKVLTRSGPKPNAANLLPQFNCPTASEIFMFEIVDGRKDARTDGGSSSIL